MTTNCSILQTCGLILSVCASLPDGRNGADNYAEPCCGDGAWCAIWESFGLRCAYRGDIADGQDALAITDCGNADAIITNPP